MTPDFLKSTTATDARGNVVPVSEVGRSDGGTLRARLNGVHFTKNGQEWKAGECWIFNIDGLCLSGLRLNPPTSKADPLATLRQLAEAHPELNIRYDEPPPPMDPIERAYREYQALSWESHGVPHHAANWRNGETEINESPFTIFIQALTTTPGLAEAIIAKAKGGAS